MDTIGDSVFQEKNVSRGLQEVKFRPMQAFLARINIHEVARMEEGAGGVLALGSYPLPGKKECFFGRENDDGTVCYLLGK